MRSWRAGQPAAGVTRARGARTAGTAAAGRAGNLTGRQAEVLRLLAAGLSNKQIAAELFLSPATVERHLATIYRNLGLAGGSRQPGRDQAWHRGSRPGVIAARLVMRYRGWLEWMAGAGLPRSPNAGNAPFVLPLRLHDRRDRRACPRR